MQRRPAGRTVAFAEPQSLRRSDLSETAARLIDALEHGAEELAGASTVEALLRRAITFLCRTLLLPDGRIHLFGTDISELPGFRIDYPSDGSVSAAQRTTDPFILLAAHRRRPIVVSQAVREARNRRHPTEQALVTHHRVAVPIRLDGRIALVAEASGNTPSTINTTLVRPLALFGLQVGINLQAEISQQRVVRLRDELQRVMTGLQQVQSVHGALQRDVIAKLQSPLFAARAALELINPAVDIQLYETLRAELSTLAQTMGTLQHLSEQLRSSLNSETFR